MNGPILKRSFAPDLPQVGVVEQSVLVELVLDIGQREFGAPHRHVQLGQNPGQRADVVFVPVRKNDAAHLLAVLDQVGNVGHNNIDAQQFGFRKHQAGVDDDDVVAPAHGHAVHPELAQSAQGHNLQFS